MNLLALSYRSLLWAVWAFERPRIPFRQLLYRHFAEHVPAREQHRRVFCRALLPRDGARKYGMELQIPAHLDFDRQVLPHV